MNTTLRLWLQGAYAAIISGGAGVLSNTLIAPASFNTTHDGWRNLGISFLVGGLSGLALYLQRSPLPVDTTNK